MYIVHTGILVYRTVFILTKKCREIRYFYGKPLETLRLSESPIISGRTPVSGVRVHIHSTAVEVAAYEMNLESGAYRQNCRGGGANF